MVIRVKEDLSVRGVHVVAYATGRTDEAELEQEAKNLAHEYGISRPRTQVICLNAAERSADGRYLIVATQDDR